MTIEFSAADREKITAMINESMALMKGNPNEQRMLLDILACTTQQLREAKQANAIQVLQFEVAKLQSQMRAQNDATFQ